LPPTAKLDTDCLACFLDSREFIELESCVFRYPSLLEPGGETALAQLARSLPWERREIVRTRAFAIAAIRERVERDGVPHRLGDGPIERIWRAVGDGLLEVHRAKERVAAPEIRRQLSTPYLRALGQMAVFDARRGDWRPARVLGTLLLIAVEQDVPVPDGMGAARQYFEQLAVVYRAYLSVAVSVLRQAPHGRFMAGAADRGSLLVETADQEAPPDIAGETLFQLGILHLDVYLPAVERAERMVEKLDWQRVERTVREWQQQALAQTAMTDEELGDDWELPPARDSIALSARLLAEAVQIQRGRARGLSLKALGQALSILALLGEPGRLREAIQAATQALSALSADRDIKDRVSCLDFLQKTGVAVPSEELDALARTPVDSYVVHAGVYGAVETIATAVELLGRTGRAAEALALVDAARALFEHAEEDERRRLLELELIVLARAMGVERRAARWPRLSRLRRRPGGWDVKQRAAALIEDARFTFRPNRERRGLALVDEAASLAPDLCQEHEAAISLLRATLMVGIAVNALKRRRYGRGIEAYLEAVEGYLALGFVDETLSLVGRIRDVVERARGLFAWQRARFARQLLRLEQLAERIEHDCGNAVAAELETIGAVALEGELTRKDPDSAILAAMFRMLKGRRTAAAFRRGRGTRLVLDAEARRLLAEVQRAEEAAVAGKSEVESASSGEAEPPLDEDVLTRDYVAYSTPRWGDTPREVLENARAVFDSYVYEALLTSRAQALPTTQDWDRLLPVDTALCLLYWSGRPPLPRGRPPLAPMIAGMLVSSSSTASWIRRREDNPPEDWINRVTRTVREAILEQQLALSERAAQALRQAYDLLFAGATDHLDELADAGISRLVIVPHRALHFFPFHLLGDTSRPLGARFVVTYLPNACLVGRTHPDVRREEPPPRTISAFGLDFKGTAHELSGAVDEARSIASLFEEEPISNERATRERAFAALTNSRYVHFATHGLHDVDAPSFQSLFLHSDGGAPVRLYAHEVLALDLRGLDLVTLSACETALGRATLADEVRGLPVNLLLAGARSVVGTLWEIPDQVAEHFFTSMYTCVRDGLRPAAAFGEAQRSTRARFPPAGLWGAFFYSGD
jgi:CHAT domain-containing protein